MLEKINLKYPLTRKVIYQTLKTVFLRHFKTPRSSYSAACLIFSSLLGVWKCGQTQSFVFVVLLLGQNWNEREKGEINYKNNHCWLSSDISKLDKSLHRVSFRMKVKAHRSSCRFPCTISVSLLAHGDQIIDTVHQSSTFHISWAHSQDTNLKKCYLREFYQPHLSKIEWGVREVIPHTGLTPYVILHLERTGYLRWITSEIKACIYGLLIKREVRIAGYWLASRSIKKKNEGNI